ncbi:MAG TPA: AAA family ATPase, partial [Gemmatimonadales bacterium]|nr:AAA family ATPase [Gemmatimonadales bacterium]
MPPHYYLKCLGNPELRSPSGDPVKFRTRKPLALLLYLAVEPRHPHRRDRLADLLWPKGSALEGRHSVATALSVLRGKLGAQALETTRDLVRFTFGQLELDLDRLSRGDVLGDEFTPALDVGGFLEDFDVADAPEFQMWRDQQCARLLPSLREAFIRLMDRCRRTGDFRRIEVLADRLQTLDDLSEDAIRAKMEARALDGDRLGALRLFEQWRLRLSDELGAQPSALIDGMAIRLRRRGWEQTRAVPLPPVFTDRWKGRRFVGRSVQYRALYEVWERTMRSQARHALVLGDSGIGKSTLVERLVTAAGIEGAASTRVQCYELERDIPYTAIGGLVRGLLDRPEIAGTPPEWLAELAALVPDLKARFTGLPPVPETQGETARIRLAEAIHQLLMAVAEEHPVIVVVDDVHLADDVSVAVLHLLMRRTQSQRIMVVLTARPAELSRAPSAARLRENQRGLGLEIIELPPLTADESAELVEGLAQAAETEPSLTVRRALVRAAAGIPMVLELLFRDWQTNGERCLALSVGAMTADAIEAGTEGAYRQILDRVVGDLDDVSRAVLNLASILGARLNDLPMYQLVDLSVAQTMAGMARLTELRLLRDGGHALDFRNEVIRAHAYFGVPSPHRTALHGRIADLLLASDGRGESVPGLEIAWHCVRAGRTAESTPYLLRGAREAMQSGAPFETEQALSSAMGWLPIRHHTEVLLLLAESLQEQGRWRES